MTKYILGVFGNKIIILRLLGSGYFGEVYHAYERILQVERAI
ncbi:hypothetical protein [Anoxybacter fermentans]|nr:hypothetical protein [Anoxybacter fermentans]